MPKARASKKSASKKSTSKNATAAADKAASKSVPKKTAVKKATKKPSVKKAAAKSPAAKSPAAKSPAAKSPAAKKTTVEKSANESVTKSETTTATKRTSPGAATKDKSVEKQELPEFLADTAWLKGQRDMLTAERGKYILNAEALAAEAHALMADRDPGDVQFDEESGEGDTLAVERDRDLALSAKAREKVDQIDAALARLDAGTYGVCIAGKGDFVPQDRLEFIPEAAKCVQHQTAMF